METSELDPVVMRTRRLNEDHFTVFIRFLQVSINFNTHSDMGTANCAMPSVNIS